MTSSSAKYKNTSAVPNAKPAIKAAERTPISIGNRWELFLDDYLIDEFAGTRLMMQKPTPANVIFSLNHPWEGPHCGYFTVLSDQGLYRMYYRGYIGTVGDDGNDDEITCYAESADGMHWQRPDLGFHEVFGTRHNNVMLAGQAPLLHNFCPFLDANPDALPSQRYKAIGGTRESGLFAFVSADGLHWKILGDQPIIPNTVYGPEIYLFDSQNVMFWSATEGCYLCYFRSSKMICGAWLRGISRTTSPDMFHWTPPQWMDYGPTTAEQLYTNQTLPYPRAPHHLVSLAARFMPGRQVISDERARELQVTETYHSDCSEVVLMSSRGSNRYQRTFMEAFVRPGLGDSNWVSRTNYAAWGLVQTSPEELSFFVQRQMAQPTAHLQRYTLRTDGFISINAPYAGGQVTTKPLWFSGKELKLNYAASAAGSIRVELQNAAGIPLENYSLSDAVELYGDTIEKTVSWKCGSDLGQLSDRPVRLRFVMKDADLYALRFQ